MLLVPAGNCQVFEWSTGLDAFLDNREYFSIDRPQTIFGTRLNGEIGFLLNDQHRLRMGLNYLYEFGSRPGAYPPDPTIYYQFENKHLEFDIGSFPRRCRLDYPLSLLSDTLRYYRPNMEGVFLVYRGRWGYQNAFIDWTSRQTDEAPERFIFGFSGNLHKGIVFFNYHLMMGHFAGKGIPDPDHHLRDNGGFDFNLGVDLSEMIPLDSMIVQVGGLVSLDRIRGVYDGWETPAGLTGTLTIAHRGVGISGSFYRGPGHEFLYGDWFYTLPRYSRLDVFFIPFKDRQVEMKFDFGLHFAKGQIDTSQQILVSLALDGSKP